MQLQNTKLCFFAQKKVALNSFSCFSSTFLPDGNAGTVSHSRAEPEAAIGVQAAAAPAVCLRPRNYTSTTDGRKRADKTLLRGSSGPPGV